MAFDTERIQTLKRARREVLAALSAIPERCPPILRGYREELRGQADRLRTLSLLEIDRGSEGFTLEAPASDSPWARYQGPHGGRGWKNTRTGRVVYQEARPDGGAAAEPDAPAGDGKVADVPGTPVAAKRKPLFTDEERALPGKAVQPVAPDAGYAELRARGEEANQQLQALLDLGKGLGAKLGYQTLPPGTDHAEMHRALTEPGGVVLLGPLKSQKRSEEKVAADYGGDWSKLLDIARASVAVDTADDVERVVDELRRAGAVFAKKPKDRIAEPLPVGYRDILCNLKMPSGVVVEVQVHLKPMLLAKEEGHKHYEVMRDIDARMAREGREEFTPEEADAYDLAFVQSQKIYDAAWQRCQRAGTPVHAVPERQAQPVQTWARAASLLARAAAVSSTGLKHLGSQAGHVEHLAREWASSRAEEMVARLPQRLQPVVRGAWWALRMGTRGAFATYTAGQALAERVARARGATPEQAAALRKTLAAVDVATAKPVVIGLEMLGLGSLVLPAALVPVGSMTYLAATGSLAGWQAAKQAVRAVRARLGRTLATDAAGQDAVESLLDALERHGADDSFLGLVLAALDETQELGQAVAVAEEAASGGGGVNLGLDPVWSRQNGPRGGHYWVNTSTGEKRYQEEMPGAEESGAQPGSAASARATAQSPARSGSGGATVRYPPEQQAGRVGDLVESFFGDRKDASAAALVVGAPEGAQVKLSPGPERGTLTVITEHPSFAGACVRILGTDAQGKKFITNAFMEIRKSARGAGMGSEIFARQVINARAHGFSYIRAHAARNVEYGHEYNGYYTWPRLGYDMTLDALAESPTETDDYMFDEDYFRSVASAARQLFPEAKTVSDIMRTKEGRGWWKEHGVDLVDARFDLTDGSRSLAIQQAYLEERGRAQAARQQAQQEGGMA